jgi:hypothetical protein
MAGRTALDPGSPWPQAIAETCPQVCTTRGGEPRIRRRQMRAGRVEIGGRYQAALQNGRPQRLDRGRQMVLPRIPRPHARTHRPVADACAGSSAASRNPTPGPRRRPARPRQPPRLGDRELRLTGDAREEPHVNEVESGIGQPGRIGVALEEAHVRRRPRGCQRHEDRVVVEPGDAALADPGAPGAGDPAGSAAEVEGPPPLTGADPIEQDLGLGRAHGALEREPLPLALPGRYAVPAGGCPRVSHAIPLLGSGYTVTLA